ncbi:glycosyltransferase [Pseudorhizobium flavum]|uniref:glycosyltransferase n=1 Tax=Pseudorhizobium flavum TaxID=1335061 RepID=UPI00248F84CF|nr:glycosyltransferase [Pseudorhizobium flavum]
MPIASDDAPLVSVIMPVYNHGRYVADALASVIDQDWRPLEIIVIDDGSTDDSLEILRRTVGGLPREAGLTVHLKSRSNQGAHATINEGLNLATGDYLAVINSDDLYLPGRLRRCVAAAQAHGARMVFSYVDPVDDDNQPLPAEHRWRSWYADVMMQELDIAPSLSALLLRYNIGVSTGNLVFHRSLVDEIGMFANYRYAHDLDFLLRSSYVEEPVLVREKLYRYRIHSSNTIAESDDRITAEVADIVRSYLARTFEQPPGNPLAPRFDADCYALANTPWPAHLELAVDGLMCDPALARQGNSATDARETLHIAPTPTQARSKITLLSHELSRTGAPVLLRDVASALHQHGVRTHVISLGSGPLAEDYDRMNSPVVTQDRISHLLSQAGGFLAQLSGDRRVPSLVKLPIARIGRLLGGVGARLRIWRYHTKTTGKGPLLINSFASWPLALPLLKRWDGPAFWYIHETYEPGLVMRTARHQERLRRLIEAGKVKLLFGSNATRAKWASEGYDGEVFYWSGFQSASTNMVKDIAGGKQIILSVQSTGPRKGTRDLIEAFAFARIRGLIPQDVELHIIGAHPPSRNALSRDLLCRIKKPDLRGRVQLIPNLPPAELQAHYSAATVYVQSSTMECLPLALLNAMAQGLPIVSTDADGCREAIINDQTGLLVPYRNPERLADAISHLINNREIAIQYGRAAQEHFSANFSLEVTASKLIERLLDS